MGSSTLPRCQRAQPGTAKTSWNPISALTTSVSPLLDDRKRPAFPPQGQMKGEDWGKKCTHKSWLLCIYFFKDIYFDSCLHHADWRVVWLSWKDVESCLGVFFFSPPSFPFLILLRLYEWYVKFTHSWLVLSVGNHRTMKNICATINCRPCWKSSVRDLEAFREWSENVPDVRVLLK